jgi:hypothetical protein
VIDLLPSRLLGRHVGDGADDRAGCGVDDVWIAEAHAGDQELMLVENFR